MEALKKCFHWRQQEIISVVGSGGKSSLIHWIADQNRNEKVLSSTTTKIVFPDPITYDRLVLTDFDCLNTAVAGITIAGKKTRVGQKLQMPDDPAFIQAFRFYDKVLLEADGSKQCPLKGWATFEPVILPQTTMTIGIVPIAVIGRLADPQIIHRFPLFQELTGITAGEPIKATHLASIVEDSQGLFGKAVGDRILFFNQVETAEQLASVQKVLKLLSMEKQSEWHQVIAGSIQQQKGVVLWSK